MVLIKKSAGAQSAGNLTRRGLKRSEFLIVDNAAGVCTENSYPGVVVMETAQDLERFDASGPLNRARNRRILVQ